MHKKNANNVLTELISLLTTYLTELSSVQDAPDTQFAYGEKTAYAECLEFIASWQHAEENGLGFDVENRFPLT
ncbi:MAG: hypothetical protein IJX88_03665 [Clostridia bacterium]|nr:hypothetical protein [Clostridia bacterium]